MRTRACTAAALGVVLSAILAPTGMAYGGPSPNPNAVRACGNVIDAQTARGTTAGGGPKAGIPAPTNCDHFFQGQGLIGNGLPGQGP